MRNSLWAVVCLALAPGVAMAQRGEAIAPGYLDAYLVPTAKFDASNAPSDDGKGFGLRGLAVVSREWAVGGEYTSSSFDNANTDVDQFRFGLGYILAGGGVFAEYTNIELQNFKTDGLGLHYRTAVNTDLGFNIYGDIGYLFTKDGAKNTYKGLDYTLGVDFRIFDFLGFVDYRVSDLSGDTGIDFRLQDLRVGIRLGIGNPVY